jgi:hypothetical protein
VGISALLSTQILDSSATGRSVLTGANAASIRTVLGLELDVVKTWNNAGTVFTGLKLDVTDTASDASSAVIDMLVGGSSKFRVSKTGQITALAGGTTWLFQSDVATWSVSTAGVSGTPRASIKSAGFQSPGDGYFAFAAGTNGNGTLDVLLYRDASNVLAQRNLTAAQTSRIYGMFTDASNYERGFLQADTNGFTIGHESLGTGTKRSVRILGQSLAGTEAVSALNIVQTWNTTGTPAAFQMNITDTASSANSLLCDLRVGAVSQFYVYKNGITSLTGLVLGANIAGYGDANSPWWSTNGLNVGSGYVSWLGDTRVFRDATGVVAQRNGTAAQTKRIYGTYTDSGNYERGSLQADTNGFTIGHEALGTGVKRPTRILGASLAGAEAVSSLNILQTWNTSGTPTMFQMNLTDTASNAASLLADWKVGANSFFTVAKDGSLTCGRFATTGFNAIRFTAGALQMSRASDGGMTISLDLNSNLITAGSLAASNGRLNLWDAWLLRDATDILAVRNANTGTNACGFRVYNTYTDASNYERARMSWESNQFVIGHEYAGTGSARSVALVGGQTGTQGVVKALTGGVLIGAQLNLSNSSNASAATSQIVLYTPAAGQLRITNATSDGFDRLFLGPATASFPMLKRNATAINFRLGDDTAGAPITAASVEVSDEVYGGSWNGSLQVPTKNALWDKIETISGGGGGGGVSEAFVIAMAVAL